MLPRLLVIWASTPSVGHLNCLYLELLLTGVATALVWKEVGGRGEEEKKFEVEGYPKLLADLKESLGDMKLTITVSGSPHQMTAFTKETCPEIAKSITGNIHVSAKGVDTERNCG